MKGKKKPYFRREFALLTLSVMLFVVASCDLIFVHYWAVNILEGTSNFNQLVINLVIFACTIVAVATFALTKLYDYFTRLEAKKSSLKGDERSHEQV